MKKVLSLVLAVMMVMSLFTMSFAADETVTTTAETATSNLLYPDLDPEDAYALRAVGTLTGFEVIDGFEDGTFGPQKTVTRAQMAKMLVYTLGLGNIDVSSSSYSDVKSGDWHYGSVSTATEEGIVNGFPDGTFRPDRPITYGQVVTMTLRTLGYNNMAVNGDKSNDYSELAYVKYAQMLGLLDQVTFKNGECPRIDAAKIIYAALGQNMIEVDKDGITAPRFVVVDGERVSTKLVENLGSLENVDVTPDMAFDNYELYGKYIGENVTIVEKGDYTYVIGSNSKVDVVPIYKIGSTFLEEGITVIGSTPTGADIVASTDELQVQYNDNQIAGYTVDGGSKVDNETDRVSGSESIVGYLNNKELVISDLYREFIQNEFVDKSKVENGDVKLATYRAPKTTYDSKSYQVKVVNTGNLTTYVFDLVTRAVVAREPYKMDSISYYGIELPLTAEKKVDYSKILVTGDASSLEDIQANDVLEAYAGYSVVLNKNDREIMKLDRLRIHVTRNSVVGSISEKVKGTDKVNRYVIEGTEYEFNPLVKRLVGLEDTLDLILDRKDKDVSFYLDQNGRIAGTSKDIEEKNVGILVDIQGGSISRLTKDTGYVINYPKAQIVTKEGEIKWFDIWVKTPAKTATPGALYAYEFDLKDAKGNSLVGLSGVIVNPRNSDDELVNTLPAIGSSAPLDVELNPVFHLAYRFDEDKSDSAYILGSDQDDEPVRDMFIQYTLNADGKIAFLYGIERNDKALDYEVNALDFQANEKTKIFLKDKTLPNEYELITLEQLKDVEKELADGEIDNVFYQYSYGWDMVVLNRYKAPQQQQQPTAENEWAVLGGVNADKEQIGFFINSNGNLVDVDGEVLEKEYTSLGFYDRYTTPGAIGGFGKVTSKTINKKLDASYMINITNPGVLNGNNKGGNFRIEVEENRKYIVEYSDADVVLRRTQLSSNLVVIDASQLYTGSNDRILSLFSEGLDEFELEIDDTKGYTIEMYNGPSTYMVDVIIITKIVDLP